MLSLYTYQISDTGLDKDNTQTPDLHHISKANIHQKINFIDLGLSVKWASCNIGANIPEECGTYFAWGELHPKCLYDKNNCQTYAKLISDISGNKNFDVATLHNNNWRIPTRIEFQELIDNCYHKYTTINNIQGIKFTSKINSQSIFLPAYGISANTTNQDSLYGFYWTSTPRPGKADSYIFYFQADKNFSAKLFWHKRFLGHNIRPILSK